MRIFKSLFLLTGLLFTTVALAEVPVIDAYQDSAIQASSSTSSAASSSNTSIVSSSTGASLPTDQRITVLERQVANLSKLLIQFNELQQQMQDLRGKTEVQKHDLQVLQEQVRSQYKDLDQRLGTNGAKTQSTRPVKPLPVQNTANDPKAVSEPTKDSLTEASTDATTTDNNGEQAYQAAFELLKKKKYTQAITSFQSFIKKYPNSKQIVNARYWCGMVYLTQGQPESAIPQFQAIIRKNPQDSKVPDSMLQLGMAYYAKGDSSHALAALKKVQEQFPESAAAKSAKSRMQQIQQASQPAGGVA